jgi:hypothetical protein
LGEKSEQVESEQLVHLGGLRHVLCVVHVVGLQVSHVPLEGRDVAHLHAVLGSDLKDLADNQQLLQETLIEWLVNLIKKSGKRNVGKRNVGKM